MTYEEFLLSKVPEAVKSGMHVTDSDVRPLLKPHQRDIVRWAVMGGKRAIFASFGLGKTMMQLEALRIIKKEKGGKVLVVCPLGVRQEFKIDAEKLGISVEYVRNNDEVEVATADILLTNYERVRDGAINPGNFMAVSLDEASVLRGYGTKTYQEFLTLFPSVPYKFVCTATPSPNRFKELIHYAGFLGVMDTGEALTRFFQRDPEKAGNLQLYPHKEREFWLWMTTWAIFLTKPSDLGHSDEGYDLPEFKVEFHKVPASGALQQEDSLFQDVESAGLEEASMEKRESIGTRVSKAMEIVAQSPDKHFILWHDLEAERHAIHRALKGSKAVYGSQDLEEREQLIVDFANGKYKYLSTKPKIAGSGCNFQRHCSDAVFVGITYKFNDFIQSVHRIYRFGQTLPVTIHVIYTEAEQGILDILLQKWENHKKLVQNMTDIIKQYGLAKEAISTELSRSMGCPRQEVQGAKYVAVNNDCIHETQHMADNSVDLIHTSIPFGNHYEYSPSYNDFGHNTGNDPFFQQMDFLTPELLRVLRPGRVAAVHVKDRIQFGNVTGYGMPSVDPFHALTIAHYMKHGFIFFGMVTIETDVVRENNQTYRLGWTEQCKDGTKMGVGCPEYLLLFRKLPSDNSKAYADMPVTKSKEVYTRGQWQIDARAKWNSSGDRLVSSEELANADLSSIGKKFKEYLRESVYNYTDHVNLANELDKIGRLPATFEILQVPARDQERVWSDVSRMRTLNSEQSRRNLQNHICLARNSMILTQKDGYKAIQDMKVGDMVLTHKGRWKPVEVVRCTGVRPVVTVRAQGVPGLVLTPDHNVWTRLVPGNAWAVAHSRKAAKKAPPAWVEAKDTLGSYLNQKTPPVTACSLGDRELRLIGRWLADGHVDARGSYIVSIGFEKLETFKGMAGEHYGAEMRRTAMQVRLVGLSPLCKEILEMCGRGAANKQVPAVLLSLPKEQAACLLQGYLSGDGHLVPSRNRYMATTASKSLAFGISMLAQSALGAVASVIMGRAPGETQITGRTVHTKHEYIVSFDVPDASRKNLLPFVEDDGAWKKVRSIEDSGEAETWCIRVEDDASFTAEGCIVKNCPLQFDIVDRVINRYTNPGEVVYDPFGGIMTVPFRAVSLGRIGYGCELNPSYWRDGIEYLQRAERSQFLPTMGLFDDSDA